MGIPELGAVLGATPARAANLVHTCGQQISGEAYLPADLSCPGGSIAIEAGGRLDLAGHTLDAWVDCFRPDGLDDGGEMPECTITGPGTVRGRVFSEAAITVMDATVEGGGIHSFARATVLGSTVREAGGPGVLAEYGDAEVVDSTVTGSLGGGAGVAAAGQILVSNSTIAGNQGPGVHGTEPASVVHVEDSRVTGNFGDGVTGGRRITVVRSDVSANRGDGIQTSIIPVAARASVENSTVNGNGRGVFAPVLEIDSSTVRGNRHSGAIGRDSLTVTGRSSIADNGSDESCGRIVACADIESSAAPSIARAACGTSYKMGTGIPGTRWSACQFD
jgi:hypothetical protein